MSFFVGVQTPVFGETLKTQVAAQQHTATASKVTAVNTSFDIYPLAAAHAAEDDEYLKWREISTLGFICTDHHYTLTMTEDPDTMLEILLIVSAFDVDYDDPQNCPGGPEIDHVYFNDHFLGTLEGADKSFSTNSLPITPTLVISGINNITIDVDATNTFCWCLKVDYVELKAKQGDFEVIAKTPTENELNRAFDKDRLDLTVQFSDAYEPSSLTSSAFTLAYLDETQTWQPVTGTFTQLAPDTFRFEPAQDLKDGIRYHATVHGGDTGIKSVLGQSMDVDEGWDFWTVPDLSLHSDFDYGQGSTCVPASATCDGLEVAVFQTAKNATLVPLKKTLVRLYGRWQQHDDVWVDDQVTALDVDVTMTVNNTTFTQREIIKRPDHYIAIEIDAAENTINFEYTPTDPTPESLVHDVTLIPHQQQNAVPITYQQTYTLASLGISPTLEFKYYFAQGGDWASGVPMSVQDAGNSLLAETSQLLNDLWPVVKTTARESRPLPIDYADFPSVPGKVICAGASLTSEQECIITVVRGEDPEKKEPFIIVTVPPNALAGQSIVWDENILLHAAGSSANAATIVHHIMHVYGFDDENHSAEIEGYQVEENKNQSMTENLISPIPIMHIDVHTNPQPTNSVWMLNAHYGELVDRFTPLVLASSVNTAIHPTMSATDDYLNVSGLLFSRLVFTQSATITDTAELISVYRDTTPETPPSVSGMCVVELLDNADNVLSDSHVTPLMNEDVPFFSTSVNWHDTAQTLRIRCGEDALLMRARSASTPTLDFDTLSNGQQLSGSETISWVGSDDDGDALSYRLRYSRDQGTSWATLMPFSSNTSLTVDTASLASGSDILVQLMATDGFNTSVVTRTVDIVNNLAIIAVLPVDGSADIETTSRIQVVFRSPLDTTTLNSNTFQLLKNGTEAITGTLEYDGFSNSVFFTSAEPFDFGTTYTIQLAAALADTNGHTLGTTWTSSFTTVPDTTPPQV
ncbi:MAG: Ig-like domain-containing protein, partial [Chloroflexota bacterium]